MLTKSRQESKHRIVLSVSNLQVLRQPFELLRVCMEISLEMVNNEEIVPAHVVRELMESGKDFERFV
jgi:hypothetical protein